VSRLILPDFRPDSCGLLIRQSNRLRMRVHDKPGRRSPSGATNRIVSVYAYLVIRWFYFSRIL
jgi:hypothetical protein